MPLFHFECPDGEKIQAEECIKSCRMAERCMTRPSLYKLFKDSADREDSQWSEGQAGHGEFTPHVTDLVNTGTRAAYLKVMMPFTWKPVDLGDLMLGQAVHSELEELAKELGDPTEVDVKMFPQGEGGQDMEPDAIGSVDYLELIWDETHLQAEYRLIDYKTYGIYLAQKLLGIGRVKIKGKTELVDVDPDFSSVELQMNTYRIMLEDYGYKIGEMVIQVMVKEGGWAFASSGIESKIRMVVVPRLEDNYVRQYIHIKSQLLKEAVRTHTLPSVCSPEDRWNNDLKCKQYCEVWNYCSHGKFIRGQK